MKYKYLVAFVLLAIVFTGISLYYINDGTGSIKPAIYFFPYPFTAVMWQQNISIYIFLLGVLQYGIYGFITEQLKSLKRKIIVGAILLAIHLVWAIYLVQHLPHPFN